MIAPRSCKSAKATTSNSPAWALSSDAGAQDRIIKTDVLPIGASSRPKNNSVRATWTLFEDDQAAVEKCALQNSACKPPIHKLLQDLPQLERKLSNSANPNPLIFDCSARRLAGSFLYEV